MRIPITISVLILIFCLAGCSSVNAPDETELSQGWEELNGAAKAESPPEVTLSDLDFSRVKYQILTEDHPLEQLFAITYVEIGGCLVVIDLSPCDGSTAFPPPSDEKNGDDDTVVKASWGEVKSLFV